MGNEVLIGTDAEFFLLDNTGSPLSAEGLIGGSKWNKNIHEEGEYTTEEDGLACEIGIKPATTAEEFSQRIDKALRNVTGRGFNISLNSSEKFDEAVRNTPQGIESGCMPSLDTYRKAVNAPLNHFEDEYRYSGAHIHISFGFSDNEWHKHIDPDLFIMSMDHHLGIPYMKEEGILGNTVHPYRRLGQWRMKPYGAEYRTLSNRWIFSKTTRKDVFNRTKKAVESWDKLTTTQVNNLKSTYYSML